MSIRINKFISEAGLGSRREADSIVQQGRVTINGKRARLTDSVDAKDVVALDDIELPVRDLLLEIQAEDAYNDAIDRRKRAKEEKAQKRDRVSSKSASLRKSSKNNPENRIRYKKFLEMEDEFDYEEEHQSSYAKLNRKKNKPRR